MVADEKGHFCMRTAQAFSDWFDKPDNGVGQGEKGSPPKHTWSVDPLLWYLHEKDHVKLGLWVGDGLPEFVVINGKRAQLVVCDGYLVAILFCDDLFLVSSTNENMQALTDLVTEFHDFQGSAMAPHKCIVGSSVPAPATYGCIYHADLGLSGICCRRLANGGMGGARSLPIRAVQVSQSMYAIMGSFPFGLTLMSCKGLEIQYTGNVARKWFEATSNLIRTLF